MQEIRCEDCGILLAIKENGKYHIKSKRSNIDVAFPIGTIGCKCGKIFIAEKYYSETATTE